MVAVIAQVEQVRYEAYGVPTLILAGDVDASGKVDATDTSQIQSWIDSGTYDVRGDVDSTDKTTVQNYTATKGGRTNLSHAEHANRKGYAGYEFDDTITHESYHVRHRVLNSVLGQWLGIDPAEYIDHTNLYSYIESNPLLAVDPLGMYRFEVRGDRLAIADKCAGVKTSADFYIELWLSPGDPRAGWVVQHVKYTQVETKCGSRITNVKSFEFWEAWQSDVKVIPQGHIWAATDASEAVSRQPPSDGTVISRVTEMKWVSASMGTGPNFPGNWTRLPESETAPGFETGPATTERPYWWDNAPSGVGNSSNEHTTNWDCCNACNAGRPARPKSISTTISPSVKHKNPNGIIIDYGDTVTRDENTGCSPPSCVISVP